MSERPTPEQIADEFHYDSPLAFVRDHLPEHGYVIVHPDDVPDADLASPSYQQGWNDCRDHIFGGDRE